ncbi:hypothetical protein Kpol_1060p56 [Vanderwaltozyma polyspora DSM 70294]|uniref:Uncharacterized protein n=1 Tax=Vanderwaltozyma polyspora (strain ATCC 22028 / DSM 70294 / BCRC 21397 / CBS 2163 / NBRC 10782 / NRRL Y-8283 / UCD 57-17) TaxID=436907 RepID=A7TK53_VANPO|nr:uncharacterized protein Kpol_1060p56 [Vanderwaltozyma polyspora DSM 70294]EDO17399.1 hypothetical protein Kpol_1060p56 [Vanderwaltozyma polyspora DSM 70294]
MYNSLFKIYFAVFSIILLFYLLNSRLELSAKLLCNLDDYCKKEKQLFQVSNSLKDKYDELRKGDIFEPLKLSSSTYDDFILDDSKKKLEKSTIPKENATLLMLVRNWELDGALKSMRSLEDRFNWKYNYDWVFLNDYHFTPEFKEATEAMASGNVYFHWISPDDWDMPSSVNETLFEERLGKMEEEGVLYGGSKSYRNMCRFNSGYFFRQTVLNNYDYYFRVEPNVEYYCDFPYDPFRVMREKKKKYGFVISMYEFQNTIPTLWDTVEEYITKNEKDIDMSRNSYDFITDSDPIGLYNPYYVSDSAYNLCHFWSNFEIGDLNFFRSEKYMNYFKHLDDSGGFYYERWGDAPVHTIAASLLLDKNEIIHFDELGYGHNPFYSCPTAYYFRLVHGCLCDPNGVNSITTNPNSCLMRWWKNGSGKYFIQELKK